MSLIQVLRVNNKIHIKTIAMNGNYSVIQFKYYHHCYIITVAIEEASYTESADKLG